MFQKRFIFVCSQTNFFSQAIEYDSVGLELVLSVQLIMLYCAISFSAVVNIELFQNSQRLWSTNTHIHSPTHSKHGPECTCARTLIHWKTKQNNSIDIQIDEKPNSANSSSIVFPYSNSLFFHCYILAVYCKCKRYHWN